MKVSKESQQFLDNLRIYLLSSGKNEQEINEIVEELEDHLYEAERNGKDVEDIIGQSPKEYMNQVADEMPLDLKGVLKYIPIILIGAFSFILIDDAIRGTMEYSLLELIGYPFIFFINLFIMFRIAFRYLAISSLSETKQWLLLSLVGMVPTSLFIVIYYVDRSFQTPSIEFGNVGVTVAVAFAIATLIGITLWSKSWVTIIIPILLFLPRIFINMTSIEDNTKLIVSGILPLVLVGTYLFIVSKRQQHS
ncbi:HAAS domain-containing protein [Pontibacillus salipaludis]|uniref:NADH dehydrogenase n=1 Tax=Pontibacillus salipaludis TaxID=1697394 RepID=A0ABQ1QE18_9BACI|nr:hypothetical protein [Pontibacillus salipaludis]GGD22522.1 NADH dehydrogenase [Pontibacillus salipaludis]